MRKAKHLKEKNTKNKVNTRRKHLKEKNTENEVNIRINTLRRKHQKKKIKETTSYILVFFLLASIIFLNIEMLTNYETRKDNEAIQNIISETTDIENKEEIKEENRSNKVKELQAQNSDIIGWLEVIGTNINYPVLQGEDNSYYMTHNYKKEKSKDGSLFLDKDYNWDKPSTNLLIYGHNNRGSKEMFVDLLKYKEESFYNKHKTIRFTTATEDAEYEIISAFLSRVYYQNEKDVFRYYFFIDANNEEEFNEYIENSKKESLYDIETTAKYGDQLLTLSTCEYSQEDGRFAVVAKKK